MIIDELTMRDMEEARYIAISNYQEEREQVSLLPSIDTVPDISLFIENGLGTVARSNDGDMLGFLGCYPPSDDAFRSTGIRGTFSPVHAHGAVKENRSEIYQRLYQSAAEKWVEAGIRSHAIGLYAHDTETIHGFFIRNFGMRVVDGIRPMEHISCKEVPGYDFEELAPENRSETLPLKNGLLSHLAGSPVFMIRPHLDESSLEEEFASRSPRYFLARYAGVPVAWLETMDGGDSFAADDPSVLNVCGAYCLPEHRGNGVFQNLLNHVIATMKHQGYMRVGVDYESFNPTANGFWSKYFTPFIVGLTRRIDERAFDSAF